MLASIFQPGTWPYLLGAIIIAAMVGAAIALEARGDGRINSVARSRAVAHGVPVLLLLLVFSAFAYRVKTTSWMPVDNTYPESAVVEGILRANGLRPGQALYQNFDRAPFAIMAYPPLYYYLGGLPVAGYYFIVGKLIPQSAAAFPVIVVMICGRFVTLCFFLALLLLLHLFARRANLRRESVGDAVFKGRHVFAYGPLWAASLFVSLPLLLRWAMTCRPDLAALFFSTLGLYLIYRFERPGCGGR